MAVRWWALAMLLVGTAQAAPAQDARLTTAQVIADIDLAEEAYQRIHPGYTRFSDARELEAAWEAVRADARAGDGMTLGAFYLAVESVLTEIRCDHTKAELSPAMRDERDSLPVYLPIRWEWLEGRGIVLDPGDTTLRAGDELIAIDGRPLAELVEEVEGFIPYDGETAWARAPGISDSLEFAGGALDHFGALLRWPDPLVELTVQAEDSAARTVSVSRISYEALQAFRKQSAPAANFRDAVHFDRVGDTVGLLRVDTFVNYRDPIDPDLLYAPVFEAMADEGRGTLILDLRSNGGGSHDAQMGLLAYLLDEPARLFTDMQVATIDMDGLQEHIWTWDRRAINPPAIAFRRNSDGTRSLRTFVDDDLQKIRPERDAFTGQLIVLTSRSNSSASTILTAFLREHRAAVLVGEPTGGSAEGPTAGLMFTLKLPESGLRTRIPFIRYTTNVTAPQVGYGVSPDISAPQTVASLRSGADPALEAALRLASDR